MARGYYRDFQAGADLGDFGTATSHAGYHKTNAKWTCLWWMKNAVASYNGTYGVWGNNAGSSAWIGCSIYCTNDGAGAGNVTLLIVRGTAATYVVNKSWVDAWPGDTDWHRYAVRWDHSLASANAILYVDGVSKGTANKDSAPNAGNSTYAPEWGTYGNDSGNTANDHALFDLPTKNYSLEETEMVLFRLWARNSPHGSQNVRYFCDKAAGGGTELDVGTIAGSYPGTLTGTALVKGGPILLGGPAYGVI